MQLTKWTDYSLRVLMHCAVHEGRTAAVSIAEIEQAHRISRSHLNKVVMALAAQGFLETRRGRGGGLRLLRPAADTTVGEVVRRTETDLNLLECFDAASNACRLAGGCRLEALVHEARARFLGVLDGVSLADLATPAVCRFALGGGVAVPVPVPAPRRRARSK
ncbi:MAG: Rrf2 family transcriptional regulator [Leptothrix sp. (in: Bacteria)]|nr:Rrf2 family transcriptional regulator [Leptothrix sp. (in: b-proteobacteria)]